MTESMLKRIERDYPLTPCDTGAFAALKAKGLRFTIRAWEAAGLGHVSLMQAKGFFGLMKMDTLIVNPTEIDLPLYSYDRILAMGNDTLIAELYDTTASPYDASRLDKLLSGAIDLPERDPGVHWYDELRFQQSLSKKGKKAHREAFDRLALAHFSAWLESDCAPLTDPAEKQRKTAAYVNGLLEHGGPSTDVFLKALGREKTEALFRRVIFGTDSN